MDTTEHFLLTGLEIEGGWPLFPSFSLTPFRDAYAAYQKAALTARHGLQRENAVDGMLRSAYRLAAQRAVAPCATEEAIPLFWQAFLQARDQSGQNAALTGLLEQFDVLVTERGGRARTFESASSYALSQGAAMLFNMAVEVPPQRETAAAQLWDAYVAYALDAYRYNERRQGKRQLALERLTKPRDAVWAGVLSRHAAFLVDLTDLVRTEARFCVENAKYNPLAFDPPVLKDVYDLYVRFFDLSQHPVMRGTSQGRRLERFCIAGTAGLARWIEKEHAQNPNALRAAAQLYRQAGAFSLAAVRDAGSVRRTVAFCMRLEKRAKRLQAFQSSETPLAMSAAAKPRKTATRAQIVAQRARSDGNALAADVEEMRQRLARIPAARPVLLALG